MLYTLCIVLILIASVLVVLAVLVQSPKSGMAANFSASNQVMGVRQTADFLEKFTWGMAVVIFVLSLTATFAMNDHMVSESDSFAAKDASNLIEKMTPTSAEPVMPQADVPAVEAESTTDTQPNE